MTRHVSGNRNGRARLEPMLLMPSRRRQEPASLGLSGAGEGLERRPWQWSPEELGRAERPRRGAGCFLRCEWVCYHPLTNYFRAYASHTSVLTESGGKCWHRQ